MQVLSLFSLINNPFGAEGSHLVQHLLKHQIAMLAPFNKTHSPPKDFHLWEQGLGSRLQPLPTVFSYHS